MQIERAFRDAQWWTLLALSTALVILINPLGFIGGGWDDWQYLNAARCWREHGPCLPGDHWQGRWPVFAPIAAITAIAGESRLTVSLWPFIASAACLVLLVLIGNRLLGRPIGWIAALLLLATPAFSIQLLDPSAEAVELACLLGGFLAILHWIDSRAWHWSFVAGLSFAMAIQVRETAVVTTIFAAIFVLSRNPRPSLKHIAVALAGFALPFVAEFVAYAISTGDPLWRRRLSVSHTLIPSSELLGPVDREHPPYFNKAYIANWRHEPGARVHWAIDGFLNLYINGKAGFSLLLVPLLLLVGGRSLEPSVRRAALHLYLSAIAYMAVLIYALAIDPKARMMFVSLAATSLSLGLVTWRLKRSPQKLLAFASWAAVVVIGSSILFVHQRTDMLEGPARSWISKLGDRIEIDENTRRHLALVPGAEALPDLGSGRAYFIYNRIVPCSMWSREAQLPPGSLTVVGRAPTTRVGRIDPTSSGSLCLFRYESNFTKEQIEAGIRRSRPDGPYLLSDDVPSWR